MIEIKGLETYFGGKGASGTYQKIINHIPECDCLISGFLGADFVIRNMNNLPGHIIGIDVDTRVCELWNEAIAGSNIISDVKIYNMEFLKVFKNILHYNDSKFKKPFFYLDPPYPIATRTSNHRYKYDMHIEDHMELLQTVQNVKYNVAISTYDNELYQRILCNWNKIHFESKTQKGMRTETLYMNYDITKLKLQDLSYTGDNYRERDRIRQKTKRWKNRIDKMSKEERDYLFTELQKFYNSSAGNIKSDVTGLHGQQH